MAKSIRIATDITPVQFDHRFQVREKPVLTTALRRKAAMSVVGRKRSDRFRRCSIHVW
ncbi:MULTISPECIES: hypothetical protein [unclassified Mesorhizobium]|uniref:hypothetical protein n=1 Tax=unclassified Mesorhizobium TaxID=325217 RepID=UPI0015E3F776|nr:MULTISPECIES: hypothetical protein [unclassified Mesorhizobium]